MKKRQEKSQELTKPLSASLDSAGEGVGKQFILPNYQKNSLSPVVILHSGGEELIILGEVKAKVESVEKKIDKIEEKIDVLTDRVEGLESLFALIEMMPGIGDKIKAIRRAKVKTEQ